MDIRRKCSHGKLMAVAVVMIMVTSASITIGFSEQSSAETNYWSYTLYFDPYTLRETSNNPLGYSTGLTGMTPISNTSTTLAKVTDEGSWGFDEKGYGPFGSFYAVFGSDGTMLGHLNPYDLTKYIDGTDAPITSCNVMWCLPTIYWSSTTQTLTLSNDPSKGTAYAHTIDGHIYEYIGIGNYEGYLENGILKSISGVSPSTSYTKSDYRTGAQANKVLLNDEADDKAGYAMIWNYYQWQLYRMCSFMVMKSFESQSVVGQGSVGGGGAITGVTDTLGPYCGNISNNNNAVSLFIENSWGSRAELIDDCIILNYYICAGQNSNPNDTYSPSNKPSLGVNLPAASISMITGIFTAANVWGIPSVCNSNAYYGITDTISTTHGGPYEVVVGGGSNQLSNAGLCWFYSCTMASDSWGTRLAYVFDSDPCAPLPLVSFNHGALGGIGGDVSQVTDYSMKITEGSVYPQLEPVNNYTHVGWYVNCTFYEPGTPIALKEDHTAYSVWKAPSITITFKVGNSTHSTLQVPKGSVGVVYTPEMVEGIFAGWYYDSAFTQKYDATRSLDGNVTLYASGVPPLVFTSEPIAVATITPVGNNMVFFDATGSDGRYSILWDFGDGNTSTDPIAYNMYSEPGRYDVKLTVTNLYNESVTETYTITVGYGDEAGGGGGFDVPSAVLLIGALIIGGLVLRRLL